MAEKSKDTRWLALEITKAYQFYKAPYLARGTEPEMDIAAFAKGFTEEYLIACYESRGHISRHLEDVRRSGEPEAVDEFSL